MAEESNPNRRVPQCEDRTYLYLQNKWVAAVRQFCTFIPEWQDFKSYISFVAREPDGQSMFIWTFTAPTERLANCLRHLFFLCWRRTSPTTLFLVYRNKTVLTPSQLPDLEDQESVKWVNSMFNDFIEKQIEERDEGLPPRLFTIGKENLKTFILAMGENNKITLDNLFTRAEILECLTHFREREDHIWGVVLLNNILGYEVRDGGNCYLVKSERTHVGTTTKYPCVVRYKNKEDVISLLAPYNIMEKRQVVVKNETVEKEKEINWFTIWSKHCGRFQIEGGATLKPFPVTQSVLTRLHPINKITEYSFVPELNLFTGYKWTAEELEQAYETPEGQEAVKIIREVLFTIFCSSREDLYNFLIEFLAYQVQYPGQKCRFALYVKGQKGIGKSLLLFGAFQQLFSHHSIYLAGQSVGEDFNGYLRHGVILMNLDEFPNNHKHTQLLKSMITESGVNIRAMYSEIELAENKINFIITSNHAPPRELEITPDERRFFLLEALQLNDRDLLKHKNRMTKLYQKYMDPNGENVGTKAYLWWLAQQPVDAATMSQRIPLTPLFRRVIENSMSVVDRFLKACIERGGVKTITRNFDTVDYNWEIDSSNDWTWPALYQCLVEFSQTTHVSHRKRAEYIEELKSIFITQATSKKTSFRLADRLTHFKSFRRRWPNVVMHFTEEKLVIDDDPFAKSQRLADQNDPVYRDICERTEDWSTRDYRLAFHQLVQDLKEKDLDIRLTTRPHDGDQGSRVSRRARVIELADEEGITDPSSQDELPRKKQKKSSMELCESENSDPTSPGVSAVTSPSPSDDMSEDEEEIETNEEGVDHCTSSV